MALMRPEQIAVDTSLLGRREARRFLMAAWERQGARLPVLPRVRQELYGVLPDREADYWDRVMRGQRKRLGVTYSPAEQSAILAAAEHSAREWVKLRLDAPPDVAPPQDRPGPAPPLALLPIALSDEEDSRAREVAAEIPAYCFRGRSATGHRGDRQVIGQAAVKGYRVLLTDNRKSIRDEHMNRWLRQSLGLNEDLVCEPDATIAHLFGATPAGDAEVLKAVLHACLPETRRSPEREAEIVAQFLSGLEAGGFRKSVSGANGVWASDRGPEMAASVREEILGSAARATEAEKVALARTRARAAGWRPDPPPP